MSDLQSLGKSYATDPAPSGTYPDTDGIELTDGNVGAANYTDTNWQGWDKYSPVITIDLGAKYRLAYARFNFLVISGVLIYGPTSLAISGSNNNVDFIGLGNFVPTTNWATTDNNALWSYNLTIAGIFRYIKFTFVYQIEWLFLSELEVYGSLQSNPAFLMF